jgi:pimeloyl-ACP methyl ester carboxylesterase
VRVKSRKPDIGELHRYSRRAPAWKGIPSWFLLAEDDRMIVPETQRYMAERMKAKIKAHAVDHTPSVTAPAAVVDLIRSVTGN